MTDSDGRATVSDTSTNPNKRSTTTSDRGLVGDEKIESYDDDDEENFFHFQYGTNEAGREADDESSDNKALPAQGSK